MNDVIRSIRGNHALLMVICCAVPMALLAAVFVFNVDIGSVGLFLIMLACPLMHVFMMKGMGHGDHQKGASCHGGTTTEESGPKANTNVPVPAAQKD